MYKILVILLLLGIAAVYLPEVIPIDETFSKLDSDGYLERRSAEVLLSANMSDPKVFAKVKEGVGSPYANIKASCEKLMKQFYYVVSSEPEMPIPSIIYLPEKIKYAGQKGTREDFIEVYMKRADQMFKPTTNLDEINARAQNSEKFKDEIGQLAMKLWLMDRREAGTTKEDLTKLLDACILNWEYYRYASPYEVQNGEIPIVVDKAIEQINLK